MAPLLSHIYELGFMEAIAIPQIECFQSKFPVDLTRLMEADLAVEQA